MSVAWDIRTRDGFWLTGVVGSGPHGTGQVWVRDLWHVLLERSATLPDGLDRDLVVSASHGRETEFTCYLGYTSRAPVDIEGIAGVVQIEILGHDYAVASLSSTQEDVIAAYLGADAWATEQGRSVNRAILGLEMYREAPRPIGEPVEVEIWIPLV